MKILHTVEGYPPSVGGMQEAVRQVSEQLVRRGHEVTVATSKMAQRTEKMLNGVEVKEFAVDGSAVRGCTGEVERYERFLLDSDFDIIANFAAQQWATDLMLPLLARIKARKVFVPTGFSALTQPAYRDYFNAMKTWFHQYDLSIFLSEEHQDIDFARACGVRNIMVIPNGAASDEFLAHSQIDIRSRLGIPRETFLILHVGSHTGIKGHAEAMDIFCRSGIKKAVLLIVGNTTSVHCARDCRRRKMLFNIHPARLGDGKRIIVTELPREETVAAFRAADIFLFPSQSECSPLVLFECMAAALPFLTTDVGNSAEIIRWSGGAGLLLPTVKDRSGYSHAEIKPSAALLDEFFLDKKRRRKMGAAGFEAWEERFTWEKIAGSYEEAYLKLL